MKRIRIWPHFFLAWLLLIATSASADEFPNRPLTLVTTVAAGGSIDAIARIIASELGNALRQPVVVEPRPGAGGNIAAAHVAKAPADGHTLLIAGGSIVSTNPHLYKSLPFDWQNGLAPVAIVARVNMVLVVHPDLNVTSVQQFIGLLRSQPGKVYFGSGGNGTLTHLAGEIFGLRTHTEPAHVAYKGLAPALNDLLAGRIHFMFDSATTIPHVKAGKLRALAAVGPNRLTALPQVATFRELGIDDMEIASGVLVALATGGTPRETVRRLNGAMVSALRQPTIAARITAIGYESLTSTPEELTAYLQREHQKMGEVIKRGRISLQ